MNIELQNENFRIFKYDEILTEVKLSVGDIISVIILMCYNTYEYEAAAALNMLFHQESGAAAASVYHESDVVFYKTTDSTDVVQDSSNDDTST